ncbi:type II and III secretion system protein family protein [Methylomicrobium agile]|uniref:type II and III secretion system protein family protein n=1 Tax=Methylomicrobium agile TaxID=39774 RepID=UPI000A90CCC1|nr:type II and III secretion system protein family protein [Methylomicrobium agile]
MTTISLAISNMNYFKALILWTLLAVAFSAHGRYDDTISIEMGKQFSYRYGNSIKRVALGDPEIADVSVIDARQLLITPKKPGSTSLMLWQGSGIGEPDFYAELLVTASKDLKRHAVESLGKAALQVSEAGDKLELSGQSASLEVHDQARQAMDEQNKSTVVDTSQLGFDSQVQIDIKIVEISRSRLQNAGLFLGKNTANTTMALSTPNNLTGIESAGQGAFSLLSSGFFPHAQAFNFIYGNASEGILGVISVLENNGFAYTLAEPSLVALSGQSANFLAGGEFPIPVPQGGASTGAITIRFKEFGVRVSLTPTVLDQRRIALKVAPEVSELDYNAGIEISSTTVPALRVRRTDTSIALGDGESFVISGLVSQNTLASVDKFPWLGDIPILGAFFRSTHFDRGDRELIMVVTPHLVQPLAKDAPLPPMPGERFRQYDPNFFHTFFKEKGDFRTTSPVQSGFSK